MKALGFEAKDEEVHKMIVDVDEDGNGGVEFDEFLKVSQPVFGQILIFHATSIHI